MRDRRRDRSRPGWMGAFIRVCCGHCGDSWMLSIQIPRCRGVPRARTGSSASTASRPRSRRAWVRYGDQGGGARAAARPELAGRALRVRPRGRSRARPPLGRVGWAWPPTSSPSTVATRSDQPDLPSAPPGQPRCRIQDSEGREIPPQSSTRTSGDAVRSRRRNPPGRPTAPAPATL